LGAIRTPVYLHVAFQQMPFRFRPRVKAQIAESMAHSDEHELVRDSDGRQSRQALPYILGNPCLPRIPERSLVPHPFCHPSMKKAAPVQQYLRLVADSLLFVLLAHKGDTNPGRSI